MPASLRQGLRDTETGSSRVIVNGRADTQSSGGIAKPGFLHDKLNMVTPTTPNDEIKDTVNVMFEQKQCC